MGFPFGGRQRQSTNAQPCPKFDHNEGFRLLQKQVGVVFDILCLPWVDEPFHALTQVPHHNGEMTMTDLSLIKEHMEIIGADGVHVGTVDHIDGDRIKLTKADSGPHHHHHHYISGGLVAGVEGDKVRLSANAAVAVTFEEERGGQSPADR
jgi:hypothetical protein